MSAFVLLTLAPASTPWLTRLTARKPTGPPHLQIHRCASTAELRARLCSGRAFSGVLFEMGSHAPDRNLIDLAQQAACATIAIGDTSGPDGKVRSDCTASLSTDFDVGDLVDTLYRVATVIPDVTVAPFAPHPRPAPKPWAGRLVAVCGTGGTGASTAAIAVAGSLGSSGDGDRAVLLADCALDADQALLHGIADEAPTVVDLADAQRWRRSSADDVHHCTIAIAERDYRLLPGLRVHAEWAVLSVRSIRAVLVDLLDVFGVVVADVDADVEGDDDTGVIEIEDRNVLARSTLEFAEVVVVVAAPGLKGLHALTRCVQKLLAFGVDPSRIVPTVNRAADSPAGRAEFTGAFAALTPEVGHPPVFVPEIANLEAMHRRVCVPPDVLSRPLFLAVGRALDRPRPMAEPDRPEPVDPSSGAWCATEPIEI